MHGNGNSMKDPKNDPKTIKERVFSIAVLFGSFGTLICCVLPALIAMIAGGAAVVSLISVFPWLVELSKHKKWIFLLTGVLILSNAYLLYWKPRMQINCDLAGGEGCEKTGRFSKLVLSVAVAIYLFGLFFSYGLVPLLEVLGYF